MEEEIIVRIAQAEEKAALITEAAQSAADATMAAAEREAREILKKSEADTALFRRQALSRAQSEAQSEYDNRIKEYGLQAKEYANGRLSQADKYAAEIVGRLLK